MIHRTIIFVLFGLATSTPIGTVKASEQNASEALKKVLVEAKQDKKAFITRISKALKQCTNGKMLELDHLTVKSSYWWNENPYKRVAIATDKDFPQINQSKLLIIDRKERSSIYDRESPFVPWGQGVEQILRDYKLSATLFVNDWDSALQKKSLFMEEDEPQKDTTPKNTIPPQLKGIADYGIVHNKNLDTYPSIYQMLDVLKTLKYESKKLTPAAPEPTSCPIDVKNIRSQNPSQVIINQLNELFEKPYYQVFKSQNHPLNKIIQDHLKKLHYMASGGQFNGNPLAQSKGYIPSIMYNKILEYIDYIVFLLSAFEIDMDKKICAIKGAEEWNDIPVKEVYNLYVQFYEVINDLIFLLMSLENPYDTKQFDQILSTSYASRFPILHKLYHTQDIHMRSYPARSGMDAFDGSCLSIGYVPQDISIASKVANLENTMYYEISGLIRRYPHRGEQRSFLLMETENKEIINLIREATLKAYLSMVIKKTVTTRKSYDSLPLDDYFKKIDQLFKSRFNLREYLDDFPVRVDLGSEEDNDELSMEERLYQEIIANNDMEGLMPIIQVNGRTCMEIPMFIASQRDFYKTLLKQYKDIVFEKSPDYDEYEKVIETHFEIDQHYSLSSGMTTDTVDLSDDPDYIERLQTKIDLIRQIKQQWHPTNEPFVMIWDTTMEIDQGPVYKLMEYYKPQIERGEIVFILIKSLQKYANLGIGKSKAGVITLIGKESPFIHAIHAKLSSYGEAVFKRSQDYALMTFFYDRLNNPAFQDNEVFYYQAVRKHAQEAYQRNFKRMGYMISGGCLFTNEESCSGLYADTFGFAVPTQTKIENGLCRYSVGLDPKGLFGF